MCRSTGPSRNGMTSADDPSWPHYHNTILEIFLEPPVTLDLRHPIPPGAYTRFTEVGLGPQFALVTACNPRGRITSEQDNRQRTEDLRILLEQRGVLWVPADGVSPDGLHREEGAAAAMGQAEARALACHFEQSAFFWYDGEAVWLIGALVDAPPRRLPPGA